MTRNKYLILILVAFLLAFMVSGCGKKGADSGSSSETETQIEEKDYLSVETSIHYSAGDDGNWSYQNQRKEFPDNEACYVRIASTAITDGFLGKGVDDEIEVTYRFTGVENCKIEVSEGKMTETDINDTNVIEFTRTINATKENKAKENIVIFRYVPDGAESVTLEVIYDDQIAEKYDELNTVYFKDTSDTK